MLPSKDATGLVRSILMPPWVLMADVLPARSAHVPDADTAAPSVLCVWLTAGATGPVPPGVVGYRSGTGEGNPRRGLVDVDAAVGVAGRVAGQVRARPDRRLVGTFRAEGLAHGWIHHAGTAEVGAVPVSYTHLRAHETRHDLV